MTIPEQIWSLPGSQSQSHHCILTNYSLSDSHVIIGCDDNRRSKWWQTMVIKSNILFSSYPLDSLVSAECDDGVMCCSAIDDAEGHTRLLVWGLRRPPARATCPAPCQGERYDAVSACTALHWPTTTLHQSTLKSCRPPRTCWPYSTRIATR